MDLVEIPADFSAIRTVVGVAIRTLVPIFLHNFSPHKAVLLACKTALCYDTVESVWKGGTPWPL